MNRPTQTLSLRAAVMAAAWLILTLAVQRAAGSERFDPVPSPPESWGRPSAKEIQDRCPTVTGLYKLIPDVVETRSQGGKLVSVEGRRSDFIRLFGPMRDPGFASLISRGQVLSEPISPEKLSIAIQQKSADGFEMIFYSYDGRREFRVFLDPTQNDFVCREGYIEIPFKPIERHAEGRTYRIDSYRRFTRMADGALLFYEQHRTWSREAIVFTKSEIRHRYYRFPPAEPAR